MHVPSLQHSTDPSCFLGQHFPLQHFSSSGHISPSEFGPVELQELSQHGIPPPEQYVYVEQESKVGVGGHSLHFTQVSLIILHTQSSLTVEHCSVINFSHSHEGQEAVFGGGQDP